MSLTHVVLRARSPKALLLAVWMGWSCSVAHAVPIPFNTQKVEITAREQPLAAFLQDLFGTVGLPVSVSPSLKGAVNGHFVGPAERVYRSISRAFNLVEYFDGSVVHIYAPQDMATRTLPLEGAASARTARAVDELGLPDERNKMRTTSQGTLVVSGTKRFIDQVEEIARANAADSKALPMPVGFKVFYLRYAWAQDVTMNLGGGRVLLPGVASTVRALMTGSARSQVAAVSLEQPVRNTVPRTREQNQARQGTLGATDANAVQPSAPALLASYGGNYGSANGSGGGGGGGLGTGAGGGSSANGMPAAQALGDAQQVRVEADARLNAVIVRDAPERLAQYEQLIAALDVEPQPIEIEATIIDINTDKLRELGINWRYTKGHGSLLFGKGDSSDLQLTPTTPLGDVSPFGKGGVISAVLGNANQFIARINALQDQGAAKVVSSPQVLTLSNVEAVFDNSQTFYVRVAGRDNVDLFNVAAGTTLRVTPHVFKDGGEVRIKMLVSVEDGSLSSRTVDTLPVVDRSSINTQAMIFEGESLLIGGITRESTTEATSQVPGLGSLPFIGALFRNTQTTATRTERMFLITPRLAAAPRRAAAAVPTAAASSAPPAVSTVPEAPMSTPLKSVPLAGPLTAPLAVPLPLTALAPTQDIPLVVRDKRGFRPAYGRGESYEIEVAMPRDGYLYCYLIDDRRRLNQFFPNATQRNAAVSARSVWSFPGSFGFRLTASRSGGKETVACVNVEKDLGFAPIALPADEVKDLVSLRAPFSQVAGSVAIGALEVRAP